MDTDKGSGAIESNTGSSGEGAKAGGNPFSILIPPDPKLWDEARRLITDKNIRVEELATCTIQDPAITIELIRIANALFFSAGRSPITSPKTAILRLGSDVVLDALEKMKDRPGIENEDVMHWFEVHRSRCRRTAILSAIIAEAIAKGLSDDCKAAGLFLFVGELVAVLHLREQYVALAEELSRSGIIYKLAQDFKFDVERMAVSYLRRQGIPDALLFAIDRDGHSKAADRAIIKPITFAAGEMVDAFDANRWEKLSPGRTLPPKSAVRTLQMADAQYLKVYERASEYLFAIRLLEEKNKQEEVLKIPPAEVARTSSEQDSLESEIQNILESADSFEEDPIEIQEPKKRPAPRTPPSPKKVVKITTLAEELKSPEDQFSLKTIVSKEKTKTVPRVQPSTTPAPVQEEKNSMRTETATKAVSSISNMFQKANSSEELLSDLLRMLVEDGPFEKSALIVVSRDRKTAIVVAARGPNIGNGQKIVIDDPLSPLAQCFSKVQSFGKRESKTSPFGSKAFAVAPIDADHDTPVALYADCGNEGTISFEARRVFRTVVEILNQKLPQLPGGIPVELS